MEAVTAVGVVSSAGHVIELTDAGHNGAGVLPLQGLAASGDERLDGPAQQLLLIVKRLTKAGNRYDISPMGDFDLALFFGLTVSSEGFDPPPVDSSTPNPPPPDPNHEGDLRQG